MKTSALYELLVNEWVSKVICCADEEDEFGFKKDYKETRQKLEISLDEDGKKLLNRCITLFHLKIEHEYYLALISVLNIGVKVGMDLQNAFIENEDKIPL